MSKVKNVSKYVGQVVTKAKPIVKKTPGFFGRMAAKVTDISKSVAQDIKDGYKEGIQE